MPSPPCDAIETPLALDEEIKNRWEGLRRDADARILHRE